MNRSGLNFGSFSCGKLEQIKGLSLKTRDKQVIKS